MRIRRSNSLICMVWLLSALARPGAAQSAPVYNPVNGHWYQVVTPASPVSWQQARDAAAALTYAGLPGHLATVTSAAENQFIWDSVIQHNPSQSDYLLGGYQDKSAPDYSEPTGGWRWVTGERWDFTYWAAGEPNNTDGVEDVLGYWSPQLDHWNDFNPAPRVVPFIVEFEPPGAPGASAAGLVLFPNPVLGGQPALGQVTLAQPAGAGGEVLSLTSSNPAAAGVPASVTVPAGASSATFVITTLPVAASTPVVIAAACAFGPTTAALQVLPLPAPAPAAPAGEAPTYNPHNGHWYQAVRISGTVTWPEARSAAAALTYGGYPGHLATVTSADENQFVTSLVSGVPGGPYDWWLGGYQDPTAPDYREPDGGWRWITGEPWSYTNWKAAEPDDTPHNENALHISRLGLTWNDLPDSYPLSGYVVEYEPLPIAGSGAMPPMTSAAELLAPADLAARFLPGDGVQLAWLDNSSNETAFAIKTR